jgi:hypothetical protein
MLEFQAILPSSLVMDVMPLQVSCHALESKLKFIAGLKFNAKPTVITFSQKRLRINK